MAARCCSAGPTTLSGDAAPRHQPSGGERYAIPFFCDSNIDWPVAAVPTTVGPDKPPKYPTTWYTDYMVWYQKRNYDAVYPQAAE
jgi:Isopenicillin N synthase and related dioxygenases